jgi:hypothetical protein
MAAPSGPRPEKIKAPPSILRFLPVEMNQLMNLVAAPLKPQEIGTPKSWEKVEARLGLQLPPDYKAFIDDYGTGRFNDFVIVFNPFAQNEYQSLFYALETLHQAAEHAQLIGDPAWNAVQPYELYPVAGGLLPWGGTTNLGETFFWHIRGAPETWETIFYNLRSGEYEVWKYSLTEFLYLLFSRQIKSVLLPDDFSQQCGQITFTLDL